MAGLLGGLPLRSPAAVHGRVGRFCYDTVTLIIVVATLTGVTGVAGVTGAAGLTELPGPASGGGAAAT